MVNKLIGFFSRQSRDHCGQRPLSPLYVQANLDLLGFEIDEFAANEFKGEHAHIRFKAAAVLLQNSLFNWIPELGAFLRERQSSLLDVLKDLSGREELKRVLKRVRTDNEEREVFYSGACAANEDRSKREREMKTARRAPVQVRTKGKI